MRQENELVSLLQLPCDRNCVSEALSVQDDLGGIVVREKEAPTR